MDIITLIFHFKQYFLKKIKTLAQTFTGKFFPLYLGYLFEFRTDGPNQ